MVTDYNSLVRYQVEYKAMLLQGETLKYLLILILPCFAKQRRDEKEERIISLGLHIIRNMLAIKDIVADDRAVGDKQELSQLQPALILQLQKFTFLDLILTLASGADKTEFRSYNMLVLDMMFLIFRTIKPEDLSKDQKTVSRGGPLHTDDSRPLGTSSNSFWTPRRRQRRASRGTRGTRALARRLVSET